MDASALKEGFLGQKLISLPKSIINIAKNNPITKNFYITDLGHYPKANHHYRRRKRGSNEYILIYCTKGQGEIILDDIKYIISPNEFFIIPKKVKHEYRADESDPWTIYWFHFNGVLAKELFQRYKATDAKTTKTLLFLKKK